MTRGNNGPPEGTIIIPASKVDIGIKQRIPLPHKDMDDYREYFTRPRGEFLTRGAALASAQLVTPDYGVSAGSARGSMASLDQTQRPITGITGMTTVSISRLQAAGSKEKYGERRNPTILRKSKYIRKHS